MQIRYFHVTAFSAHRFGGNPAGVCPLEAWLPDETMQRMAAEHHLSETAFLVKASPATYDLRWFTPTVEVDLCGHATLAAAHILWSEGRESGNELTFLTRRGPLTTHREEDKIAMNFPAWKPEHVPGPADARKAFGIEPLSCGKTRDYLFEFRSEEEVRNLKPDANRLAAWSDCLGIIATAPGREIDFVSRFFAPGAGILEDPVTGSAHCTLVPFWSARLGKTRLHARQVSARGGELFCEARGDRVKIAGQTVTYLRGSIEI